MSQYQQHVTNLSRGRELFKPGCFKLVPTLALKPGDAIRHRGRPDRVIRTISTDHLLAECGCCPAVKLWFTPVNGAPAWQRVRALLVEAARPDYGPLELRTTQYVPVGHDHGVQELWFSLGTFAWVPGMKLQRGDTVDTDYYAAARRTIEAVSDSGRIITLIPHSAFDDDDRQLHGTPDTMYWARRLHGDAPVPAATRWLSGWNRRFYEKGGARRG